MTITPRPGDIGLAAIAGDVGKGIAAGQILFDALLNTRVPSADARKYQHAFVLVDDGMIVEAEPGGAVHVALHYENVLWLQMITLTDLERQLICLQAMALTTGYGPKKDKGVPYSFTDYLALAMLGTHVDPFGVAKRIVGGKKSMICSQLADYCYAQAGVHLFEDGRAPGDVIPAELAYIAQQLQP